MKTLKRRANAIPLPVGNEDTQLRKHGHDQLLERISAATAARVVPAADAKAWCGYLVVEGWEDRRISGLDFAASLHLPTVPSPAASSFAQPQTLYPRRLVSLCRRQPTSLQNTLGISDMQARIMPFGFCYRGTATYLRQL